MPLAPGCAILHRSKNSRTLMLYQIYEAQRALIEPFAVRGINAQVRAQNHDETGS